MVGLATCDALRIILASSGVDSGAASGPDGVEDQEQGDQQQGRPAEDAAYDDPVCFDRSW